MIRYILVLFCFLHFTNAVAQNYSLSFEQEDKKEKNFPLDINVKSDGTSILVGSSKYNQFSQKTKELTLSTYDTEMQLKTRTKFNVKDFENMTYEMSYTSSTDNVYLILSDFESKTKTYYTFKVDANGALDKSTKTKLFVDKGTSRDEGKLALLMSDDRTHQFIRFIGGPSFLFSSKNSLRLLKLKGENEVEWDKTIIQETPKKNKDIKDVIIADHGEILVHFTSKTNSDDAKITNQYSLYSNTGKFVSSSSAESKGKFYENIKFVANRDGSFNIYGFYSDKKNLNKFNGITGFNYSTITNKLEKVFEFKLESDLLENVMKKSKAEKGAEKGIPSNYKIRNVFADSKGNFIVAAEEEYIKETTYSQASFSGGTGGSSLSRTSTRTKSELINGNVLIFSLSNDGKILWSNSILKRQTFQLGTRLRGGYGVSISTRGFDNLPIGVYSFDDKDNVYFFLNDNKANVNYQQEKENEKKKAKTMRNLNKANTYVYKFDKSDGSNTVDELFKGKGNKFIIFPKTSVKVNDNKHIIYASTAYGNDILGVLEVNNPSSPPSEKPMKETKSIEKTIEAEDPEVYNEIVDNKALDTEKDEKTIESTIKKEEKTTNKNKAEVVKEKTSIKSTSNKELPVKDKGTKAKTIDKEITKVTPTEKPENKKVTKETPKSKKVITTAIAAESDDELVNDSKPSETEEVSDKSDADSIEFSIPEANKPVNTAVSNGVPLMENEDAVAARELKYKAPDSEVEKYIELRKKFEIEAAEQKIKDEQAAKEKAAKELKEYNDRHATPKDINEFEQFRTGQKKTENTKKEKSADEEYKALFD